MSPLASLKTRNLQPELMDQPELDDASHRRALAALERINLLSRTVGIVWPQIRNLARTQPGRTLRVLDIASGGGDVVVGLWRKAQRAGLSLEVTGVDFSPLAIEHARALAQHTGAAVRFERLNVLEEPLPAGYDVVMTSLFLHHLSRDAAVRLLGEMSRAAGQLMVVNDLRRSTAGYWLAQAVCQIVTRSPVVHVDGPRSVAGAFTIDEARQMCAEACLSTVRLQRCWPFRYLLTWRPETVRA